MQLLVKTLKEARAAKAEEEEKKRKEEEENKKLTSMQQMAKAIKAARAAKLEEQRRAEEEAKHKEEMHTAPIINIASMADALMKAKDENAHLHEGHVNHINSDPNNLQELADNKIKQTIWNDVKTTANNKRMDLSSGIGLALLSKAMGVHRIENKYMRHIDNIRKTKLMNRMEMRIRV